MVNVYLPIMFALFVGLTGYWSNKFNIRHKAYYHKIVSFSAGVSITYLLLELFPTFTEIALSINKFLFISVLVGFIIHHIIEKRIYQHNSKHELVKLLSLEEHIFSFVYHIILGIVLVTFYQESSLKGILFFVSIVSYTIVSMLPTTPHKSRMRSALLSSSTLLGVLFASFIWTSRQLWQEFLLVGLAVGVLIFTIIRHHIPQGRRGRIGYFTLGFILYSLLIIGSWYI
jgi:hypothetical protein